MICYLYSEIWEHSHFHFFRNEAICVCSGCFQALWDNKQGKNLCRGATNIETIVISILIINNWTMASFMRPTWHENHHHYKKIIIFFSSLSPPWNPFIFIFPILYPFLFFCRFYFICCPFDFVCLYFDFFYHLDFVCFPTDFYCCRFDFLCFFAVLIVFFAVFAVLIFLPFWFFADILICLFLGFPPS